MTNLISLKDEKKLFCRIEKNLMKLFFYLLKEKNHQKIYKKHIIFLEKSDMELMKSYCRI